MNPDIKKIVDWAINQGWTVVDDAKGYTRFYRPDGDYVTYYPATPSNPGRRMAALQVARRHNGLELPPPSKSEQRSRRKKGSSQ